MEEEFKDEIESKLAQIIHANFDWEKEHNDIVDNITEAIVKNFNLKIKETKQ